MLILVSVMPRQCFHDCLSHSIEYTESTSCLARKPLQAQFRVTLTVVTQQTAYIPESTGVAVSRHLGVFKMASGSEQSKCLQYERQIEPTCTKDGAANALLIKYRSTAVCTSVFGVWADKLYTPIAQLQEPIATVDSHTLDITSLQEQWWFSCKRAQESSKPRGGHDGGTSMTDGGTSMTKKSQGHSHESRNAPRKRATSPSGSLQASAEIRSSGQNRP